MKLLKWLLGTVVVLMLILSAGVAALVYLVDWNDFKDTIQNQVKKQTGRDLQITGDLSPSVFPWAGISLGEISLANAEGFGDIPFASIDSADVKVKLLPLIKREINVRTVQLKGLQLDLQVEVDGTTNWEDLLKSTTTTTTINNDITNTQVMTEVEGSSATIAALSVGGIEVLDANVSWRDATTGTDAALSGFNLRTDAIELEKPFALNVDFSVASNSLDLTADIKGSGELMIDLDSQVYTVRGFTLTTDAKGGALPAGGLAAILEATVLAKLSEQSVEVPSLKLSTLGLELAGKLTVDNLGAEPAISGQFASNEFSPKEVFSKLAIEAPVTADESVLSKASLTLALAATPSSAELKELSIVLDDTTFSGEASLPSLAGVVPPVRFDFAVDAIDLDRYLPPVSETSDNAEVPADQPAAEGDDNGADTPIELPTELMRQLDIDGTFRVNSVKVSHLTTSDIVIPLKAAGGKLALQDMHALLYEGQFKGTTRVDVGSDKPAFGVQMSLNGIEADPLLADLLQKDSFLSGRGEFAADVTSSGNSINEIMAGLNGQFNADFADGSINGINLGYQIRRAKAALTGNSLPEEEQGAVQTDFSSLSVSGLFTDGVMKSDDFDMRSPLLRLGGAGTVDLPEEQVDYTLTSLITGTAQGQGGADLASLKGVKLDIPIKATFDELGANFAGVILSGLKDNITANLKEQAKVVVDEKAAELRAQAEALKDAKGEELKEKAEEVTSKAVEEAKDKLKELFK